MQSHIHNRHGKCLLQHLTIHAKRQIGIADQNDLRTFHSPEAGSLNYHRCLIIACILRHNNAKAEYEEKQCHYKQFSKEKYFFLHACIPSVAYCKNFLQHPYFSTISNS